ncbi:hypothetical protein AK812_SmicGene3027 [Symbiodinium microadriaticum]|uniref:Uncharacterized protein n=1 Tax=Symbiodinium microadriaticum TaxID=2951 RepID=A0A1Q9F017_SYMMI|nr:hypothetical protein AK812_SmicGene3027 [Symbiodinium microadriaticum]CAE7265371.1 unnamed protein product [Symbiodinium sp. KB8]CAE7905604.1 unnamed protein product [Symbiodinium microadriaticum]
MEVRLGVTHASMAFAELELQLVELLEVWMGWPTPPTHQPPVYLTDPNFVPSPPPPVPPAAALPARPLELLHLAFLALLYRDLLLSLAYLVICDRGESMNMVLRGARGSRDLLLSLAYLVICDPVNMRA